jgi:hypothetical protein
MDIYAEYEQIRGNFVEEMQKKIDQFKIMRNNYVTKCVDDCQMNLQLDESEKPEKTIFSRVSRKSREKDKLRIKEQKCEYLIQNPDKCITSLTTTADTKRLFIDLKQLQDVINELYEMYEKEQDEVEREKNNFINGKIDIRIQNMEGEFETFTVPRNYSVLDAKQKYHREHNIAGDFMLKNTILEDNKTLRDYNIKSGDRLVMIPKKGGAAKKRKTMRKKK